MMSGEPHLPDDAVASRPGASGMGAPDPPESRPAPSREAPPRPPAPPRRAVTEAPRASRVDRLRTRLGSPSELRDAFLLSEVLGPPVGQRRPGR